MDSWHATFLGRRHLPREVTAFEVEVFFQFSAEEARIIKERRRPELKLGLALQIGFLRMSGRLLDAVRMVPPLLWLHLGARFGVAAPDLASLRAMYRRAPTLIEHQQLACDALGFQWLTGHHRRALVRVLRQELDRTDDRERLLGFARSWLYEQRLIIVHERLLRSMIAAARREHEAQLARRIDHAVEPGLMIQSCGAITAPHGSGSSLQTWLWATRGPFKIRISTYVSGIAASHHQRNQAVDTSLVRRMLWGTCDARDRREIKWLPVPGVRINPFI